MVERLDVKNSAQPFRKRSRAGSGEGCIIRADMDRKCLEIIGLTWDLAKQEHSLLALVIPATLNVAKCLSEGRQPSSEEIGAWNAVAKELAQKMSEITESFTAVREAVTPILPFDS
jgi:hypothetical protein